MSEHEIHKGTVVVGVIVQNKKVLIIERSTIELGKNQTLLRWVFPGGRPENGESDEEALIREIQEETGRTVTIHQHLTTTQHPEFPVTIRYFFCTPVDESNAGINTREVRETRWVDIDELPHYFTSSLNPTVAAFLETQK